MPRKSISGPSPEDVTTLLELLRLQAGHSYVQLTSATLGENLHLRQQSASRRLVELERRGMIDRRHTGRGFSIKLTTRGLEAARSYYSTLKGAIEGQPDEMTFRGRVFTGFGEGGYYVSLHGYAKQFQTKLGFEPFPGTLNLRITSPSMMEQRKQLQYLKGIEIQGFEDGNRTYGPVKCFKAKFEGQYQAAVLGIERTHYDHSVIEVIAPFDLRKTLGIKDGDERYVVTYMV
jgi:riboflavin kinase, archaea type